MSQSRRSVLDEVNIDPTTHAGLWLDKFLKAQNDETSKKALVMDVEKIQPGELYRAFFERWKQSLEKIGAQIRIVQMKKFSRLAINLGADNVIETSIALHRTYGVPFIPGSALKGLAASYAHQHLDGEEWRKKKDTGWAHQELFGTTKIAGCITFFDALYIPKKNREYKVLWPDVITPHHPEYNQGQEGAPPADWDNPTPIHFLTTTGEFLLALAGSDEWVNTAFKILELALEKEGIGAKTSSGYGRMTLFAWMADQSNDSKESAAPQIALPTGYQRGVVKKFIETYGFIQPDTPGPDIFVHISNLAPGVNSLQPRQRVIYKPGPGKKPGQIQANDVRLDQ